MKIVAFKRTRKSHLNEQSEREKVPKIYLKQKKKKKKIEKHEKFQKRAKARFHCETNFELKNQQEHF